jgi:hypothetical protein
MFDNYSMSTLENEMEVADGKKITEAVLKKI